MKTGNHEADEEQAFLPDSRASEDAATPLSESRRPRSRILWHLRILIELMMASTIIFLLFFRPVTERKTIRRTPVPQFPRKITTFHSDPKYTREDMFYNESNTLHTLHNWIELSSESRGYIFLSDSTPFDLPEPYITAIDRHNDGPTYMMSVFHQLHCLSYLAEHFQQGYGGTELTEEVARHSAHCFSYIRQGITCNADTTLEGKTDAGPGEGSEHECVDYEALLNWANEHAAYKWRNGLLPDESTL